MEQFASTGKRPEINAARTFGQSEQLPTQVETWLLVPVAAPDFRIAGSSGKEGMLSARRGKPVLLYFGSADLPDWNAALANFQKVHEAWLKNGLQFVPVDVAAAKPAGGWTIPLLNAPTEPAGVVKP